VGQSALFWAAVVAATAVFALVDLDALSRRRIGRVHSISLIAYLISWAVWPVAFWRYQETHGAWAWLFPAGVRIAVLAVFVGGRLLASAVRGEQAIAHRSSASRPAPTHSEEPMTVSPEELAAEEAFEKEWRKAEHERLDRPRGGAPTP
jgi:hypothetical protein